MDNIGGVNVKTTAQQLIHEILAMIIREVLPRIDYSMHIGLHQVRNDVDVLVPGLRRRFLHVDEANNVLVVEELYRIKHI